MLKVRNKLIHIAYLSGCTCSCIDCGVRLALQQMKELNLLKQISSYGFPGRRKCGSDHQLIADNMCYLTLIPAGVIKRDSERLVNEL